MDKIKRINGIKKILTQLNNKETVNTTYFYKFLNESELAELDKIWEGQKELRTQREPYDLKYYRKLLQKTASYFAKTEQFSGTKYGMKFNNLADDAFENALEYIRDICSGNSEIEMWLDRDVFVEISPVFESLPRVIGSKGFSCKQKKRYGVMSKREIRISFLEQLISRLEAEENSETTVIFPNFRKERKFKASDFSNFKF